MFNALSAQHHHSRILAVIAFCYGIWEKHVDIIKECFNEFSSEFKKSLSGLDFSELQAERFLAAAGSGIMASAQKTGVFQTIHCLLTMKDRRQSCDIDMSLIAKNSGVETAQVKAGFHAIAPVLLIVYTQKTNA